MKEDEDEDIRGFEHWLRRRMSEESDSCPEESSLLAFGRGELAPDAAASIVRHLDLCGECNASLLLHQKASGIKREVSAIPQQDLPAIPGRLRKRVFSHLTTTQPDNTAAAWLRTRFSLPRWSLVPVAAVLLMAVYPVWRHVHQYRDLRDQLANSNRPFADLEVLTLFGGIRSEQQLPEVRLTHRLVVLQISTLADLQQLDRFRVEVEDESGRVQWKLESLQPSHGTGAFLVAIPGATLSEGRHEAILIGSKAGAELLREEYEFLVVR
ncbi:MAG: hypothetical protein AB1714_14585 [Acidobacteriota bacterium]